MWIMGESSKASRAKLCKGCKTLDTLMAARASVWRGISNLLRSRTRLKRFSGRPSTYLTVSRLARNAELKLLSGKAADGNAAMHGAPSQPGRRKLRAHGRNNKTARRSERKKE